MMKNNIPINKWIKNVLYIDRDQWWERSNVFATFTAHELHEIVNMYFRKTLEARRFLPLDGNDNWMCDMWLMKFCLSVTENLRSNNAPQHELSLTKTNHPLAITY